MNRSKLVFVLYAFSFVNAIEKNDVTTTVFVKCWWKGILADPYSCEHFLYCAGPNQNKAIRYACPKDCRFDPKKNICSSSLTTTCYEWSNLCKNHPKGYLLKHPYSAVWATCGATQIFTCPSHHHRPTRQSALGDSCVFECPYQGFFPEPLSKGQLYHACVIERDSLVDHVRVCAPGTVFLPPDQFCTPVRTSSSSTPLPRLTSPGIETVLITATSFAAEKTPESLVTVTTPFSTTNKVGDTANIEASDTSNIKTDSRRANLESFADGESFAI